MNRHERGEQRKFWISETQLVALRDGHTHVSLFDSKNILDTIWYDQRLRSRPSTSPDDPSEILAFLKKRYRGEMAILDYIEMIECELMANENGVVP